VTITGTNFSATPSQNDVSFVNLPSYQAPTTVTAATPTSLTVTVPGGLPLQNSYSIQLRVQGGPTVTSSGTFLLAPTPTITSITPNLAPPGIGVTISGTGFSSTPSANVVNFNGTTATVTAASSTSLTTSVPTDATSGPVTVLVNRMTATSPSAFTVGLPAPASITVPATSDSPHLSVSWSASQWALSYQLQVQAPDQNWYDVTTYTRETSVQAVGYYNSGGQVLFSNGATYTFRVRACRGRQPLCSAYTTSSPVTFNIPLPPAAPQSVSLPDPQVTAGVLFRVDWVQGTGGGTPKYWDVFVSSTPSCTTADSTCHLLDWNVGSAVSTTDYTYAPTQAGKYYIGVRATNGGGSSAITMSTTPLVVVSSVTAQVPDAPAWTQIPGASTDSVTVTWEKSDSTGGAAPDHYEIQRSLVGGAWTYAAQNIVAYANDPDVLSYTDTAVPASGHYWYRVRACNSSGCSAWTAAIWWVDVTISSAQPIPTVAIVSPTSGATFTAPAAVTISATASVTGDSISKVEFYSGATLVCSATGTTGPYSCTWNNVPAGNYGLKAKAYGLLGGVGTSSVVNITVGASATVPQPPTSVTVPTTSSSLSFNVTWTTGNTTPAATSFTLYRVDAFGNWTLLSSAVAPTGNTTIYAETVPSTGAYSYEVAACNGAGCSGYTASNTVQVGSGTATETYYFHHTNAQGSVVATTNAVGQVVAASTFRPFGTRIDRPIDGDTGPINPPTNHLGFTGKWHDDDLQLDYFGARYYDPMVSRFLSLDQAESSFNRYAYGDNNSVTNYDPNGLYTCRGYSDGCPLVAQGVAVLGYAALGLPWGSLERGRIENKIAFLGEEGVENGVEITVANPNADHGNAGGELGHAGHYQGLDKITLDIYEKKGILDWASSTSTPASAIVAGVLAHETTHIETQTNFGYSRSRVEELGDEVLANYDESHVYRGLQTDAPWGTWTNEFGYRQEAIDANANSSTAAWCNANPLCP